MTERIDCPNCGGSGYLDDDGCSDCLGMGTILIDRQEGRDHE